MTASPSSDEEYDSSSSSSSSSSEDYEEQWSLRVRLLSAVDLPPSLSPTVPLCPWFKFGLVEDIVAALSQETADTDGGDQQDVNHDSDDHDSDDHDSSDVSILERRRSRKQHDNDDSETDSNHQTDIKSTPSKKSPNNMSNPIDHLLTSQIPPSHQRTSSSKLMSKSTNGGGGNGADWNEEYRWDALQTPMESALVVKLCTRLSPENHSYYNTYPNSSNSNNNNSAVLSSGGLGGGSSASSAIGSDDLILYDASDNDHNSDEMSQHQGSRARVKLVGRERYII